MKKFIYFFLRIVPEALTLIGMYNFYNHTYNWFTIVGLLFLAIDNIVIPMCMLLNDKLWEQVFLTKGIYEKSWHKHLYRIYNVIEFVMLIMCKFYYLVYLKMLFAIKGYLVRSNFYKEIDKNIK